MINKLLSVILSCLSIVNASNIRVSNLNVLPVASSETPINTQCKLLSNCSQHLWLLQNKHNIPGLGFREVLQYLQDQRCGFEGNDPKVRCPMGNEIIEDEDENISPRMQDIQMRRGGIIYTPPKVTQ